MSAPYAVGDLVVLDETCSAYAETVSGTRAAVELHHGVITEVHDYRPIGDVHPEILVVVRWPGGYVPPLEPGELRPAPAEPCCTQEACPAGAVYAERQAAANRPAVAMTYLTECPAGHLGAHPEVSDPGADPVVVECSADGCGQRWEIVVWGDPPSEAAGTALQQLPEVGQ